MAKPDRIARTAAEERALAIAYIRDMSETVKRGGYLTRAEQFALMADALARGAHVPKAKKGAR